MTSVWVVRYTKQTFGHFLYRTSVMGGLTVSCRFFKLIYRPTVYRECLFLLLNKWKMFYLLSRKTIIYHVLQIHLIKATGWTMACALLITFCSYFYIKIYINLITDSNLINNRINFHIFFQRSEVTCTNLLIWVDVNIYKWNS